jgi:hypothetical protein
MDYVVWCEKRITACSSIDLERLRQDLKRLGELSGIAQGLNNPISSLERLQQSCEQRVVIAYASGTAVAFLKYGTKSLYLFRPEGLMEQREVECILDFYCLEDYRGKGVSIEVFRTALNGLNRQAHNLAYDRPSKMLIGFMRKHYGLVNHDLQPNRYALFDGFWI